MALPGDAAGAAGVVRVGARITLKRGGVEFGGLVLDMAEPPVVEMNAAAQVKMTMTALLQNADGIDFVRDRAAVYLQLNGEEYPMGEYVFTGAERVVGQHTAVRVTGMDLTVLARQSVLEESAFFPRGSLYTDAVRTLLMESGITNTVIAASGAVFQNDREDWPAGTDRLSVVNALLAEMNYNSLFMHPDGSVRAMPWRRPAAEQVAAAYHTGQYSILCPGSVTRLDAFRRPNVFHVSVENPDLPAPLYATSENNDPLNPYSVPRAGRVAKFVRLDNIPSAEALQQYADNLKLKSMATAEEIVFETGPSASHGVFDVIALHKPEAAGLFEETGWRLMLAPGAKMRHTARRTVV